MKKRLLFALPIVILCVVSLIPALSAHATGDSIQIIYIEPDAVENYTNPITFTVIVNYSLGSKEEGTLCLGFNTETPERYSLVDKVPVSMGVGTVALTGTVMPAAWGAPNSPSGPLKGSMELMVGNVFGAYVQIADYPYSDSLKPLDTDIWPIKQGTPTKTTDKLPHSVIGNSSAVVGEKALLFDLTTPGTKSGIYEGPPFLTKWLETQDWNAYNQGYWVGYLTAGISSTYDSLNIVKETRGNITYRDVNVKDYSGFTAIIAPGAIYNGRKNGTLVYPEGTSIGNCVINIDGVDAFAHSVKTGDSDFIIDVDSTNASVFSIELNGLEMIFAEQYFWTSRIPPASQYANSLGQRIADVDQYRDGITGECVWYVRGRANEKLGVNTGIRGDACTWWRQAQASDSLETGDQIRSDSIACFSGPTQAGHVVFVEYVSEDWVYYTEANVDGGISDGKTSANDGVMKRKSHSDFETICGGTLQGYIYLK